MYLFIYTFALLSFSSDRSELAVPLEASFAYFASLFICSVPLLPAPSWLPKFHQVPSSCKRWPAKMVLSRERV